MNPLFVLLLCTFVEFSRTCLPTQNVEVTTTTEDSYPCSVCTPVYSSTCLDDGECANAAEAGVSYLLGILSDYGYGDDNTCSTIFTCPLGTTSQVRELLTGLTVPGPSLVIATCSEVGDDAGTWYLGIPPLSTPIEIVATSCTGIIEQVTGK